MKEFDTILKENDIVAKNDYWAYPNNMKLYQYSSKKVGIKIHLSATVPTTRHPTICIPTRTQR